MGRPKTIEDEELLAAARAVFVEKGIGASTREIAKAAGISEAVIYQRHATKKDLFFATMVPPPADVTALFTLDAEDADICERLEELTLRLLDYFREAMPIFLPLVTHPAFDFERFVKQHPDSPMNQLREGVVAFLETLQKRDKVRSGYLGHTALALVATALGIAFLERLGVHGGTFSEDMVRGAARGLWLGLAPPSATAE